MNLTTAAKVFGTALGSTAGSSQYAIDADYFMEEPLQQVLVGDTNDVLDVQSDSSGFFVFDTRQLSRSNVFVWRQVTPRPDLVVVKDLFEEILDRSVELDDETQLALAKNRWDLYD